MIVWILLGIVLLVWIGLGYYLFHVAFCRVADPDWTDQTALAKTPFAKLAPFIQQSDLWVKTHKTRDCAISSADGLALHGQWIPAEHPVGTLILFHGFHSSPVADFSLVLPFYHKLNFNILLPDQRSHGQSQGKYLTFGAKERLDVLAWIQFHNQEFGAQPVYLGGMSMGAATVLAAAELELPENVCGIVADSSFTSPKEIIAHVWKARTKLPAAFLLPVVELLARTLAGFSLEAFSTPEALSHAKIPVLLLHGTGDTFVPCAMSRAAYDACASEKQLILVSGAGHGKSYLVDQPRCQSALENFYMDHLPQ